ncbi:MAG: VWA domain-containing protein [Armatimonadetes bacterium]|nr:VWA domain-containing protein [Armatimonadota bacterium]
MPVLIHLLARRRARRVPFPSLRLLRAAEKKRRTFSRLQQPLSLLLRMLAVCLIALALAGPVIGTLPAWVPLPRTHALAVVLDDTLSMTAAVAGRTPFERARESLDAALAALGPADRVALVRASSPGEARWQQPRAARERLSAMQPRASGAKLAPALLRATEALREMAAPNRTVLVVTDLQASAWEDPPPSGVAVGETPVLVHDVGSERAANVAVTGLELLTPSAVIGRPVRLQATLSASSAGEAPPAPAKMVAQLLSAGRPVAASEVPLGGIGGQASASAQFSFVPGKAEDTVVCVGLTSGPFGPGSDDMRYCTLRVRPPLEVVVVSAGGVGRYVAAALNPFGQPGRTGMDVRLVEPSALTAALAGEPPDLLVVANCPALGEDASKPLVEYIGAGGGILVFLGDSADTGFLTKRFIPTLTSDRSLGIGPVDRAQADQPLSLTDIDTARAPLSAFANPRAGDLGAMRFTKARRITVGTKARVLASFDNGLPALIEWPMGGSHLVLFNTSADGSWGEHIRSPAYVPLLHRLAMYLARPARPSITDVIVGERPAIIGGDPPGEVMLTGPDGQQQTVPVQDRALPEVKVPGEYRVRWGTLDLAFAANVDPRESDLTRTTEAAIRKALAPAQVTFVDSEATAARFVALLPTRADLSLPLLLCALLVLAVESVLSIIRRGPEEGVTPSRSVAA